MKSSTVVALGTVAILFGFDVSATLAQAEVGTNLSEIEQKFSFVEIWDIKGRSRKDFLEDITSRPASICEQSLIAMGHPDGHKFPLASGKVLLTTRSAPDYRKSLPYRKYADLNLSIDNDKWASRNSVLTRSTEAQLLPLFLKALDSGNQQMFDRIYSEQKKEFATYRIELDAEKIRVAHRDFVAFVSKITKQEVLSILYLSNDESLLRAASFMLSPFLQNGDDLLETLPLLLRQNVGVQAAIASFVDEFSGTIDWRSQLEFIPSLVNNPNPFRAVLVLKTLDKTGLTRNQWESCSFDQHQSLVEILTSGALVEEKNFVLSFLNRYSTKPLGDSKEWLKRLPTVSIAETVR